MSTRNFQKEYVDLCVKLGDAYAAIEGIKASIPTIYKQIESLKHDMQKAEAESKLELLTNEQETTPSA